MYFTGVRGLGLVVMEAKEDDNACLLTYVLPYDIHEVKPKIGTFTDEDLQEITQLEDPADVTFLELAYKKGMKRSVMELALSTCKHYHRHQVRKSGERFYLHPVAVAAMLLEHTTDEDTIVAGLPPSFQGTSRVRLGYDLGYIKQNT